MVQLCILCWGRGPWKPALGSFLPSQVPGTLAQAQGTTPASWITPRDSTGNNSLLVALNRDLTTEHTRTLTAVLSFRGKRQLGANPLITAD